MSQLEQKFIDYLCKHPEIEKCLKSNPINRRKLAKRLIDEKIAEKDQIEAIIAMLRRVNLNNNMKLSQINYDQLKQIKLSIKNKICILNYEKNKNLFLKFQKLITEIKCEKGETFKIVIGSQLIKLVIDHNNLSMIQNILKDFNLISTHNNISELSILFPKKTTENIGLLSTIASHFALNNINLIEFFSSRPELILYMSDENIMKAYGILKNL